MKKYLRLFSVIILVILTVGCSVRMAFSAEKFLNFYGNNKAYADDVLNNTPLEKTEKIKENTEILIENLSVYALRYFGENAFSDTPNILSEIERIKSLYNEICRTETDICKKSIEENSVDKERVEKGYIVLTEGDGNIIYEGKRYLAQVNEEKIKADTDAAAEVSIESTKTRNVTYSRLKKYVSSLIDTEFAVYDKNGNLLVTNGEYKTLEDAKNYFKSSKAFFIHEQKGKDKSTMLSDAYTFLQKAELYESEEDYTLLVSTSENLRFNESYDEAEAFYAEMKTTLNNHTDEIKWELLALVAVTVLSVILGLWLVPGAKRKKALILVELFAFLCIVSALVTATSSRNIVETLSSGNDIVLAAGISSAVIKISVPVFFLAFESLLLSVIALLKKPKAQE